ncbi:MAG: hypothetical protein PVJ23_06370 [Anaerolineae bacterium]|jgi:uncharacterized phage infection (PIP) family protein YhgE
MNANQMLGYLDDQRKAIEALIEELDEIQVAFNAQYDDFRAKHDQQLERLASEIVERLQSAPTGRNGAIPAVLRTAIEERLPVEVQAIKDRRQKVRDEYLPQRQQAADSLLQKAQAEVTKLRALNPQINDREEELKQEKAQLESRLAELNTQIGQQSRGLGLLRHFRSVFAADRERQRIIGQLEIINRSLRKVRKEWESKRTEVESNQAEYQKAWQLESIAVARLQSELDQLEDEAQSETLALRRATTHTLDAWKTPADSSDPELEQSLKEMMELNIQTDDYHTGLASVGGMIGLLRGIMSGLEAIGQSVEGIKREQEMHSAYLPELDFRISEQVQAFNRQWASLARRFKDEQATGAHPAEFTAAVQPLLEGPLSQVTIEAMFESLGASIEQATERWE